MERSEPIKDIPVSRVKENRQQITSVTFAKQNTEPMHHRTLSTESLEEDNCHFSALPPLASPHVEGVAAGDVQDSDIPWVLAKTGDQCADYTLPTPQFSRKPFEKETQTLPNDMFAGWTSASVKRNHNILSSREGLRNTFV